MLKIKRRRYLVNKGMQLRYIALIFIPLIALLSALYYLMYYAMLNQILIPEGVIAMLLPAMRKINIIAVISAPVILLVLLRIALIYSNRIVGPLARIEKEIDKILSGDYSLRLKARDKDELNNFIRKINMLLDKIEKEKKGRSNPKE